MAAPHVAGSRAHWKWRATRCAVIGCESTRRKGWSTCGRFDHYPLGKSLYGAGRIDPIPAPAGRRDGAGARLPGCPAPWAPDCLHCDDDHCRNL